MITLPGQMRKGHQCRTMRIIGGKDNIRITQSKDPQITYHRFFRQKNLPKRYKVSNSVDKDSCRKAFYKVKQLVYFLIKILVFQCKKFAFGVFSVGCACSLNITYGFEAMILSESALNIPC